MTPTTEANWRAAFGLALALVGDRGRAEELAQEAFLRVAERGEVEEEQRPLLLATVRNLSIDELRRYRAGALDDDTPKVDAQSTDPSEELEARERRLLVREGLATLEPTWRAAVYLRDGIGLSYAQIGEVLDKSDDVVRVTLHRARRRLREWLEVRLPEVEGR